MNYNRDDIEFGFMLFTSPTTTMAIIDGKTAIKIENGKEVDRRPVEDYGFRIAVKLDENFDMMAVVYANDTELLTVKNISQYAYDGDILTANGSRTLEEGIELFRKIALYTLETYHKIIFILPT